MNNKELIEYNINIAEQIINKLETELETLKEYVYKIGEINDRKSDI